MTGLGHPLTIIIIIEYENQVLCILFYYCAYFLFFTLLFALPVRCYNGGADPDALISRSES